MLEGVGWGGGSALLVSKDDAVMEIGARDNYGSGFPLVFWQYKQCFSYDDG